MNAFEVIIKKKTSILTKKGQLQIEMSPSSGQDNVVQQHISEHLTIFFVK